MIITSVLLIHLKQQWMCFNFILCPDNFCMKKTLLSLSAVLLSAVALCQTESGAKSESHFDAMLAANIAMPFPEMKKAIKNNMGDAGFGISLLYLSNPLSWGKEKKASPVRLGAEIGYTYYGRFKSEIFVNGFGGGDYKTSYGIAKLNAIVRLRPAYTHTFTPFADVFAGGNFYLSSIRENLGLLETSLGLQSIDFGGTSSASFTKGVAVGFSVGALQKDKARFVCRISYTDGSSIRYIVRNSLRYDPNYNQLVYQEGRAPLRYIMIEIGIGI